MDNIAETARKALEILDRDGWCQGEITWTGILGGRGDILKFKLGSHCLGGVWNLAVTSETTWLSGERAHYYAPLITVLREQYPEHFSDNDRLWDIIPRVNDAASTTEADIRVILEKLAAKEEI